MTDTKEEREDKLHEIIYQLLVHLNKGIVLSAETLEIDKPTASAIHALALIDMAGQVASIAKMPRPLYQELCGAAFNGAVTEETAVQNK